MINVASWKDFRVGDLFEIHPTKAIPGMSNVDCSGVGVPLVVNSAVNNGVAGLCDSDATESGGIITFSDTTDGNTFFYQPNPFVGFAHVQGMYPINHSLTTNQALFICSLLTFDSRGRYNYGRKMRRDTIADVLLRLPADSAGNPDWAWMEQFVDGLHSEMITTELVSPGTSFDGESWQEFLLRDLYEIRMGNKFDMNKMSDFEPSVNFVSRISFDNGVVGQVDVVDGVEPFPAGLVTVALGGSYLGSTFVQHEPFYTAQNVAVMTPIYSEMSQVVNLFLASLVRFEARTKYCAFGRELNVHINRDFNIKLPVDSSGNPDWAWIENYMKSLPYSDRVA